MAVAGAKPKDEKVTRHPLTHGWIEVPDVAYSGHRPKLGRAGARTKVWWENISTMPHCVLWTASDWQFALDTALVHANFVKTGRGGPELRVREKQMGTTLDARRDLRIRYVNPLTGVSVTVEDNEDDVPAADRSADDRLADFEARRRRRLLEAE